MKTIHLIRHAKSSWEDSHLSDLNRPLSKRGLKDCRIMASALLDAGVTFERVYCSPAQRAQLTIQNLATHWQGQPFDWQVVEDMYTFSSSNIWPIIQGLNDDWQQVVLVGHNPAFTDFINESSGMDLENLPTCAYARISFTATQWQDAATGGAELQLMLKPKMYKNK